jgi:hypothetical protein
MESAPAFYILRINTFSWVISAYLAALLPIISVNFLTTSAFIAEAFVLS